MGKKALLILLISLSGLAACTSTQQPPLSAEEIQAQMAERYKKEYRDVANTKINIKNKEINFIGRWRLETNPSATELMIIKPSDTAKVTALKTTTAILKIVSMQGFSDKGFSKHDLKGNPVQPSLPNPTMDYLYPEVAKWVQDLELNEEAYNKQNLYFEPGRFYLVYEKLAGREEYQLYSDVSLSLSKREKLSCNKSSTAQPLNNWLEDDYALVKSEMEKQLDECLTYFQNQRPVLEGYLNEQYTTNTVKKKKRWIGL